MSFGLGAILWEQEACKTESFCCKVQSCSKLRRIKNQAKILYFTYAGLELTFHQVMLRILLWIGNSDIAQSSSKMYCDNRPNLCRHLVNLRFYRFQRSVTENKKGQKKRISEVHILESIQYYNAFSFSGWFNYWQKNITNPQKIGIWNSVFEVWNCGKHVMKSSLDSPIGHWC